MTNIVISAALRPAPSCAATSTLIRSSLGCSVRCATTPRMYSAISFMASAKPLVSGSTVRVEPVVPAMIRSDHCLNWSRRSGSTPRISQITRTGSGMAIAATRSISSACRISFTHSRVNSRMSGSHIAIRRGVKPRLTRLRISVCRGGSSERSWRPPINSSNGNASACVSASARAITSGSSSGLTPGRAPMSIVRMASEENSSGLRRTNCTSSYRDTHQAWAPSAQ